MKQHITIEQLDELTKSAKNKLRKWWKPTEGDWLREKYWEEAKIIGLGCWSPECECLTMYGPTNRKNEYLPLLSISQLIEFLDEIAPDKIIEVIDNETLGLSYGFPVDDFCDDLWEAVKEVLEDGK